jgi:signal transduction histidine kinase
MAKTFVRISLATKFRVLFAAAVLAIIAAALGVPWYFMERLVDESDDARAEMVAGLYLHEWARTHQDKGHPPSLIAKDFTDEAAGRRGPSFMSLLPTTRPAKPDPISQQAVGLFREEPKRKSAVISQDDDKGERIYRHFYAVRATSECTQCHDRPLPAVQAFTPGQLIGLLDVTMPPTGGMLRWVTRGVFVLGGVLAAILAFVVFYVITQQIILSPVRKLRDLADKVAEGDLRQRADIATGDEFERLGRRFNEMLDAINTQQERLRQANRALDLKLNELSQSNVALYEANRIKNEFLANVSHELRTPLNSIIGFAELLAETDDEKRKRHAGHILSSSRMLLAIINDLLDLARIEAGKSEVRIDKVSVLDLCETLAQLVHPIADKKQLALEVQLAPDVPVIPTDGGKLQQILYNLLSNAIKFTPSGGKVVLSANTVGSADSPLGRESVAVKVADNGPGIPSADQQRIFEKFHRLDNALTREHSGAGLGLAISRELCNLLGAKLVLASEAGQGATFTVFLPLAPAGEPAKPAIDPRN